MEDHSTTMDLVVLINEMPETQCRAILSHVFIGRLGCSVHDVPYVVPVCFAYESEHIYMFSTLGQKVEWMRMNPKVCVEVEEVTSLSQWATVIVSGHYQELLDPLYEAERRHARQLLERRSQWWLNALGERLSNGVWRTDRTTFLSHRDYLHDRPLCRAQGLV